MKIKFSLIPMMILFIALSSPLLSQRDVSWDTYGVGFTVPNDFKVTVNNSEEFGAENAYVSLYVIAWLDEEVDEEDLADGVEAAAAEFKFDEITDVSKADVSDFIGYAIQGRKEGVNAVLLTLLDQESSTNLVVSIVYSEGYLGEVQKIYNSIYAYDL